jgi:hypothetical protein
MVEPIPTSSFEPPGWAKAIVVFMISVVLAVVGTISWLNEHYATKAELALVARDVAAIEKIERKVDEIDAKIVDLRVLVAQLAQQ